MAEQAISGGATKRKIDLQTCVYLSIFLGLAGSIFYSEVVASRQASLSRFLPSSSAQVFQLPEFASDRGNYPSAALEQLKTMDMLEAREPEVAYTQRVLDWELRVRLADKLLTGKLTEKDYRDTITSQLYSLVNLSETRNLQSRERMLQAIDQYREHPFKDIQRLALIGDVGIGVIDFLKIPGASAEPAIERCDRLLEQFPNDEAVCAYLDTQATTLVSRRKKAEAIALLNEIEESTEKDSKSPFIRELVSSLPDRMLLIEASFEEALERLSTNQPGADQFLLDSLDKIASHPTAGQLALSQIQDAAYFYEQTGRFASAKDVYQVLERKMGQNRDPGICEKAKQTSLRGYARMESLGKPLQLSGQLPDGKVVNEELLKNQLVVLYFWCNATPEACYQTAMQLDSVLGNYRNQGVVLLGIGTDADSRKKAETVFKTVPEWDLQLEEHQKTVDQLEQQFGIPESPYLAILDKQGKVCAINVPVVQLQNQLDSLLGRRRAPGAFSRNFRQPPAESEKR